MKMEQQGCLICNQPTNELIKRRRKGSTISDQLHVIFVLRQLLQIPVERIERYLEASGESNPDSWISLCGGCDEETKKARAVFEELVKANKKFQEIQQKAVEKVTESWEEGLEGRHGKKHKTRASRTGKSIQEMVADESREFVVERKFW